MSSANSTQQRQAFSHLAQQRSPSSAIKSCSFFLAGALHTACRARPTLAQCVGQLCHAVARHRACGPALAAPGAVCAPGRGAVKELGAPKQARGGRQHPGGGHQRVKAPARQSSAIRESRPSGSAAHTAPRKPAPQKASALAPRACAAAALRPVRLRQAHRGRSLAPLAAHRGHCTGCGIQRRPLRPVAFSLGQAQNAGRHMRR